LNAGRDVLYRETQFKHTNGTARIGIYSARSIQIAGELCIIFIVQDITDRRQLMEDRLQLEQQLYQSQKMDAIGQLAGGVAHDFNNILMGIQGNTSLVLLEQSPEHPHYQKLSRIEEHVKRGANLTRQLLGFARGGKYEVKTLAINDLIRKSAQFFIETRKEIEADFQLQEDAHPVEVDAGQIEQVLLNVFINAGHAMPKGGQLHIQTTNVTLPEPHAGAFEMPPGDYVKIAISDTGTGMDGETLKRIFEPFFTTKSDKGGSGLGLASAYGIIRNHGGIIKATSKPGVGSTFNIFLPSSKKNFEEENEAANKGLVFGRGGILLVDDEPMILSSASELLKMLGYTVYQSASGQEAVSTYLAKKDYIDLVILDMILPGMSGAQVLKMLKESNPDVKIILSSGYGMQGEVQNVMESGCRGFIQKPYLFTELSSIVHQVLFPVKRKGTEG
jgi:two-component system, cell cycle sensor histidine kinase and response regulator CckA